MSLDTSGLCKLVHKKSDFYESSSRSNEPISESSENIFGKINQLPDSSCHLSVFKLTNSSLRSCERATLLLSKYIYIVYLIRLIPNDVITLCLLGDSNIFEYCDQWRLVVNSHCSPFEMSKARQKPIW